MFGSVISDTQRQALASLCDTFVPSLQRAEDPHGFWARCASDLEVPTVIELMLSEPRAGDGHEGIQRLLSELAGGGFAEADAATREQIIASQSQHATSIDRLRAICLTLFYGLCDGGGTNPNWPAIGYPGPQPLEPVPRRSVEALDLESLGAAVRADACVVGSGAGGGVAAAVLAEAGLEVVVLEMGEDFAEPDFEQRELTAYRDLYYRGGPFRTDDDGQITMMAGSTLGGGTAVNWSTCLEPPAHVRREWARAFGLEGIDGADFDRDLRAVAERISVNESCSDWNGANQRLIDGCAELGYSSRRTSRNADEAAYSPESAGFIGYGDRTGSKQGTAQTFLRDAAAHGARVIAGCRAERILVDDGRATGVLARAAGGGDRELVVHAPRVVVSGGSLESPALLLRSGIGGPAVGRHLKLQPGAAVLGVYPDHQQLWWGAPQTALCDEFADLGDGHGFLVECGGSDAGLGASAQPWVSGAQHKECMALAWRVAPFLFFIRDHGEGRVVLGADGAPRTLYRVSDERDRTLLRRGLAELSRIHRAAGADEVYPVHRELLRWRREDGEIEGYMSLLDELSLSPARLPLYATHLLGTCRMGDDPERCVADPRGRLHDTAGVWIADASGCPSAPAVNPMLTTMALARRTASMSLEE